MRKKDFDLIAESIRRTLQVTEWTEKNQVKKQAKIAALRLVASDLTASLAAQNPKFKKDTFYKNCGFVFM